MSSQQNSQNWQRGTNQYGNQYDHRGEGAAQGGKANEERNRVHLFIDLGNYHYSNRDGSYYYQNTNGSTFYQSSEGSRNYTAPQDNPRTGQK